MIRYTRLAISEKARMEAPHLGEYNTYADCVKLFEGTESIDQFLGYFEEIDLTDEFVLRDFEFWFGGGFFVDETLSNDKALYQFWWQIIGQNQKPEKRDYPSFYEEFKEIADRPGCILRHGDKGDFFRGYSDVFDIIFFEDIALALTHPHPFIRKAAVKQSNKLS